MHRGKGVMLPPESSTFKDRATGAVIHQVTGHPSINHPTYFLHSSFTPDGQSLIFTSYRTGKAQLYETAFTGGGIRQLTEGEAIHPFSPAIHPDGREIYFVRRGAIWSINRKNLAERQVACFPDSQLGECSLDRKGEWLTAAIRKADQPGIAVGRTDGTGWTFISFPRTVIHPQFHPLDPEWIEFAADPAPRMHRVRRDGSRPECLYDHDNEEFVVHETFLGETGDLVFTVWPKLLCRMDRMTKGIRTIAEFNAWHITPDRSGDTVLCDTNHPDRGLFLIDVATGSRRQVCLSESTNRGAQWSKARYALAEDFAAARSAPRHGVVSWMEVAEDTVYGPQWTHPHPSFSADERWIAFASDRTGHTQVHVTPVPR